MHDISSSIGSTVRREESVHGSYNIVTSFSAPLADEGGGVIAGEDGVADYVKIVLRSGLQRSCG